MFSITSLKFAFCQVILNTKFHNNSAVLDNISLHTVSVRHFHYDFMYNIELTWDLVQAPESMRAVVSAIALMTNAVGNLITLGLTAAFKPIFDADELVRRTNTPFAHIYTLYELQYWYM